MSLYARVRADVVSVKLTVVLGTAIILPFYAIGWMLGKIAKGIWSVAVWLCVAAIRGAKDGWGG